MRSLRCAALCALLVPSLSLAPRLSAQRRAITVDDYLSLTGVGDPQLSPDGKWVAYTRTTISLEQNRGISRIWLAEVATGQTHELSQGVGSDRAPRWSPDGHTLAFLSGREEGPQIWITPAAGWTPKRVSRLPDGVGEYYWRPGGNGFLAVSDVKWPADQEIDRRNGAYPTDAKLWTGLMYRHFDEWRVGQRQHLFAVDLASGAGTDLTPVDRDVPTIATSGDGDVAISPEGKEIAVAFHPDSTVADNTNVDVFVLAPDGSGTHPVTAANLGADNTPRFSPDGKWLAYLSMARPGFEADRLRLMLLPRNNGVTVSGPPTEATVTWTLSISSYVWCPDSKCVYAVVEERGRENVYRIDISTFRRSLVVGGSGVNTNLTVSADGKTLAWLHQTATAPGEVWVSGKALTHVNDAALAQLDLRPLEPFGFVGALGDSVFGYVVKPPGFDPAKKYPLVYLIHGGPQGAWDDNWHARWNYQIFASRGYVVAAVNFHGSTGYGQAFTDAISRHWGDTPYEDLMKGVDAVARLPYVDSTRMGAAGASYGGYMIYWMAGHTDRFKVLVDHDGVFNPASMFGSTEELWFPLWEFGGSPYRGAANDARDLYERWSPLNFVAQWKTPMLIIHSQHDFRLDLSEGLQAFTALKLRGVPAKFLYFPAETHFVTGPRDRRLWWGTVLDWLDQYLK